jgi:hypothetical protein
LQRDGSFRVALLERERKDLLKNFHGMIEITAGSSAEKIAEVHIDKLSTDPARPYKLVVPGKLPASGGQGVLGEQSDKK